MLCYPIISHIPGLQSDNLIITHTARLGPSEQIIIPTISLWNNHCCIAHLSACVYYTTHSSFWTRLREAGVCRKRGWGSAAGLCVCVCVQVEGCKCFHMAYCAWGGGAAHTLGHSWGGRTALVCLYNNGSEKLLCEIWCVGMFFLPATVDQLLL